MDALDSLTDEELVALCLERGSKDDRPFAELFRRHYALVKRVAYRYFPQELDSEDLAQEVFFKAYRSLKEYRGRASFKTWLFSIATNTAKNEIRKRSRRPRVLEDPLQEFSEALSTDSETQPQQHILGIRALQEAFARLDQRDQAILTRKDSQERTYEEVAELLDLSVSAAKMRVHRARLAMKTYYGND
jgi:RNA polymerase sigma-70 factor (ECF subfamily)